MARGRRISLRAQGAPESKQSLPGFRSSTPAYTGQTSPHIVQHRPRCLSSLHAQGVLHRPPPSSLTFSFHPCVHRAHTKVQGAGAGADPSIPAYTGRTISAAPQPVQHFTSIPAYTGRKVSPRLWANPRLFHPCMRRANGNAKNCRYFFIPFIPARTGPTVTYVMNLRVSFLPSLHAQGRLFEQHHVLQTDCQVLQNHC